MLNAPSCAYKNAEAAKRRLHIQIQYLLFLYLSILFVSSLFMLSTDYAWYTVTPSLMVSNT